MLAFEDWLVGVFLSKWVMEYFPQTMAYKVWAV